MTSDKDRSIKPNTARLCIRTDHDTERKLHIVCGLSCVSKSRFLEASLNHVFETLGLNEEMTVSDLSTVVRSFLGKPEGK